MAVEKKVYLDVTIEDNVSGVFENIQESAKETADVMRDYFGEGSALFSSVVKGLESYDDIYRRIKRIIGGLRFAKEITFAEYEAKLIEAYKADRISLKDVQLLREKSKQKRYEYMKNQSGDYLSAEQYEENLLIALKKNRISQKDYEILSERNKKRQKDEPLSFLDNARFYPEDLIELLGDEYYKRMRFADDGYMDYRKTLIDEDVKYFKKALGDKFNEEKYRLQMEKEINKDYIEWFKKEYPQIAGFLNALMKTSNRKGNNSREEKPKRFNEAKFVRDTLVKNEFGEVNRLSKEYLDAFSDAVGQSFNIMRVRLAEDATEIEQIWGNMINRMLGALQGLVAEWLVFNTLASLFGMSGFGSVSFKSLLGIPKLSGGGDFIVPPGFPNDSFPMLVQSGERVRVTPAGSAGSEARLLVEIRDALYALNLNRTKSGENVQVRFYVDGREVAKASESAQKKMTREGRR